MEREGEGENLVGHYEQIKILKEWRSCLKEID